MQFLTTLLREDSGQDMVEYALLVAFFGVALLAVWTSITAALGITFTDANAGVQGLWDPPAPGGGTP